MSKTSRFVDFRAVKAAVTMEQVLARYGILDRFKRGKDSLSGPCPIHQGSNPTQFRVCPSKNCWNCFSECKCGGNVLDFVAKMQNVETMAAANLLVEWFSLDREQLNAEAPESRSASLERPQPEHRPEVPRPTGAGPVASAPTKSVPPPAAKEEAGSNKPLKFHLELDPAHAYLTERGLSPETVAEFGIGFCGKGVMAGRIAIPIQNAEGQLVGYDEARLLALDLAALKTVWHSAQDAWFLVKWLRLGSVRRQLSTARSDLLPPEKATLGVVLRDGIRLVQIKSELTKVGAAAQTCLGAIWAAGEPSAARIGQAQAWGEQLNATLLALAGEDQAWQGKLREAIARLLAEGPAAYGPGSKLGKLLVRYRDTQAQFNGVFEPLASELRLQRDVIDEASDHLAATRALTERLPDGWPKIREWCSWQKARNEAMKLGLAPLLFRLETYGGDTMELTALFERSFRKALFFAAIEREASLCHFVGDEHNARIGRFRLNDAKLAALSCQVIQARLAAGIPQNFATGDVPREEMGLLRREIAKRSRHIPVRRLLAGIPKLLPQLKPCVLMSPLSVAQYLETKHQKFDVVIFDEASQIPVWDAVGAIARGTQLVVVGDPKQLPPTNFFASAGEDDDNLVPEEHKDLESILDELMSNGLRHKRLKWHYRSRHEGLIAFSNRHYYDNELLTFPSPEAGLGGVRFRYLPKARYDKGKSRTNRGEAEALVKELGKRLRQRGGPPRSYGVVTFSLAQQELVENLLDEERRDHPEIESHFGDTPPVEGEPVFVKNLESVQGDERDVILFSICYGPDETGRVSMNFGPLNRDGGERRLNVAITRAKHEVIVFSGLRADQIDLTRTRARGVRDLKFFLDYAERGPKALASTNTASADAEPDSEFERMVADRVRAAGFTVHHQIGCSGYRIDLGVVDPAAPGRYLLGVECDGATYHRAATARDRDKLRQLILEDLGWTLHRIWSTDWWHNSEAEMKKLLLRIGELTKPAQNRT